MGPIGGLRGIFAFKRGSITPSVGHEVLFDTAEHEASAAAARKAIMADKRILQKSILTIIIN
jgi:hypothetical protein